MHLLFAKSSRCEVVTNRNDSFVHQKQKSKAHILLGLRLVNNSLPPLNKKQKGTHDDLMANDRYRELVRTHTDDAGDDNTNSDGDGDGDDNNDRDGDAKHADERVVGDDVKLDGVVGVSSDRGDVSSDDDADPSRYIHWIKTHRHTVLALSIPVSYACTCSRRLPSAPLSYALHCSSLSATTFDNTCVCTVTMYFIDGVRHGGPY